MGKMEHKMIQFDADRTIIEVDRKTFIRNNPELVTAYSAMYKGMAQTLIDAEWSAGFDEKAPKETLRLVIERKVDKFR
jgi:hypothetical protein